MRITDRTRTLAAALAAIVSMAADSQDCHHHFPSPPGPLPIRVVLGTRTPSASQTEACIATNVEPRSLEPFQHQALEFTFQNTCREAVPIRISPLTSNNPFLACDTLPAIATSDTFTVAGNATMSSHCTLSSLCVKFKIEVGSGPFAATSPKRCTLDSGALEIDPLP
jgi:hypothetical protein